MAYHVFWTSRGERRSRIFQTYEAAREFANLVFDDDVTAIEIRDRHNLKAWPLPENSREL